MANTVIQLKYSSITSQPPTLNVAEPAYSNVSGVLWIDDGTGVVAIGGKAYTQIIDNATDVSTGNTLILRDLDGSFSANVVTADNIVVNSGDITGANTIHANYFYGSLATETGVTEGSYGSTTEIPVISVSANGLITNVTTASISTSLNLAGDGSSTGSLSLANDTLTLQGGDGISAVFEDSNNTFIIDVDNTVIRTSGTTQTIGSDLSITGNLVVSGTTTYVNTAINQTYDSMIELAANNTIGDVLDIGFYGKHEGADGVVVTGLVRNAGTSDYYLFDNIAVTDQSGLSANDITQSAMSANGASLYAKTFLASEGGTNGTGFAFGVDQDTGMFSSADGHLEFFSNNVKSGVIDPSNGGTAFGMYAAETNQGYRSTALGYGAGNSNQGGWSVAIGLNAGSSNQGNSSVAVGHRAGGTSQGAHAVAVGVNSGQNSQSEYGVAIGYRAGYGGTSAQGTNAVAIGAFAGRNSQVANSIALNASGSDLDPANAGFYVNPIRYVVTQDATYDGIAFYNSNTKELTYSYVLSGGSF